MSPRAPDLRLASAANAAALAAMIGPLADEVLTGLATLAERLPETHPMRRATRRFLERYPEVRRQDAARAEVARDLQMGTIRSLWPQPNAGRADLE